LTGEYHLLFAYFYAQADSGTAGGANFVNRRMADEQKNFFKNLQPPSFLSRFISVNKRRI